MKKQIIFLLAFIMLLMNSYGQKKYSFSNEFSNWKNRSDYYNWKVYMIAGDAYLGTIKQIEYNLDPTFKNPKRVIVATADNKNFTLCSNGWGEFVIRIRIVFKDTRVKPINETYKLDLQSSAKKSKNYRCP